MQVDNEIPLLLASIYLFRCVETVISCYLFLVLSWTLFGDLRERQSQVGSLAGAAHLLNHNAGVLRGAHGEQKSPVEQKGKSPLDFDFQCEYKP